MNESPTTPEQCTTLKWGTLKGWNGFAEGSEARKLLERYHSIGASMSAMTQTDTDEQRQLLIDLVSLPGMKIYLDWDGKYVTKDEAIKYLTEAKQ